MAADPGAAAGRPWTAKAPGGMAPCGQPADYTPGMPTKPGRALRRAIQRRMLG